MTLDFPNKEVLESISTLYLSDVYSIKDCVEIGNNIWDALKNGEMQRIVDFFNVALSELPYDGLEDQINEYFFRALFLMLLRCVGIIAYAEKAIDESTDGYVEFTLPLVYRSFRTPRYVIVIACASYYGNYFTGGRGSVLYVDEFSFVYD